MTKLADIYKLLCRLGVPVTYREFSGPKENIPDPPYIAYYEGRSDNTGPTIRCLPRIFPL